MWGGVGRGKTYLMDSFFDALPIKKKKRLHFHRFMYWVHHELTDLSGQSNPLVIIADKLAEETSILCFDEFFVSDIADAMILGNLLEEMFKRGISLVATSNIVPDQLYWNGLQRERFLPAIALVKKHTEILNVDGGIDYRLRTLEQAEIYHSPLDQAAIDNLQFSFTHLAVDKIIENSKIVINGREISVVALADGIVWLDYKVACASPRSAKDYIELSKLYQTALVANIPRLNDEVNDEVRRFISLVDEFYERNVKLIISAAVPLEELYVGSRLAFEFRRTLSRLQEMQSLSYLAKPHLP
jgi:cell division protein ZapE